MASWSALRRHIREKFEPSLKKRLDLHYIVYDGENRWAGWKERKHWRLCFSVDREEKLNLGCCGPIYIEDKRIVIPRGQTYNMDHVFGPDQAIQGLKDFLNMKIDTALQSDNPVIRGLAIADARFGQRRLEKLKDQVDDMHEIEKFFYNLRKGVSDSN